MAYTIKVKKIPGLVLPTKAHNDDAFYDVVATSGPKIVGALVGGHVYKTIDYIEYGTNLFIEPLRYSFTELRARSSISKYNLILANNVPVIDNSYRGEIKLRFKYIIQPEDIILNQAQNNEWYVLGATINRDKIYHVGDRIAQIRAVRQDNIEWVVVDELNDTSRGAGGFGSSGC